MKYALFIGRWQPFHKGHEWLIDQKLKVEGVSVCIAIRDMPVDPHNPLTTQQVVEMLEYVYEGNEFVKVIVIPDIESVNYGRGVGYEIIEHLPPSKIGSVSATEIRHYLSLVEENTHWEKLMNKRAVEWWKNFLHPYTKGIK